MDRELHLRGYNLSLFNLGGQRGARERLFSKTMVYKQIDALLARIWVDFKLQSLLSNFCARHHIVLERVKERFEDAGM